MNSAFRDELKTLLENSATPCVSLFMPTHRGGPELQQDPIRWSNLMKEAEARLVAAGLRAPVARGFLEEANRLSEDLLFWRHQLEGLAVYISRDLFRTYRLPFHLDQMVVVTERFHLKPLMRLVNIDGRFYVLALSQKEVKLFEGTHFAMNEVKLEGVPRNMDEALGLDDVENKSRLHTLVRGGGQDSMFRGHGGGWDDTKLDILRYFLLIDSGLHSYLKDERAPLVVAAVDYLLPLYSQANNYHYMLAEGVTGNPFALSHEELREKAWSIVEPHLERDRQQAIDKFMDLIGTELTTGEIEQALLAAQFGRIDTLFIPVGVRQWGKFDPSAGEILVHAEPEPKDEDLLDLAAIQTFLHRGKVYAVEPEKVPGGGLLAATYRY